VISAAFVGGVGVLMGGVLLFLRETREATAALRIPESYLELERRL
jgi:hypothetical protein